MTQADREELKKVFESTDTYASTMLISLADMTNGLEFMEWDPDTIRDEVYTETNAKMPQENMDKIMALVMVLTTDSFYRDVDAFIHICNSMAGEGADFKTFDPAEMDEISWAVTELMLNDPKEDEKSPFDEDVEGYIANQAAVEGFIAMPKMLEFIPLLPKTDKSLEAAAELGAEMMGAAWEMNHDKTLEVEAEVEDRLREVIGQIRALPLEHGSLAQ